MQPRSASTTLREAEGFVVFSRINGTPGREGIGCVLVNRHTPGFEVTAIYHTMGGENLAEIQFNNLEVPVENVLLREGGVIAAGFDADLDELRAIGQDAGSYLLELPEPQHLAGPGRSGLRGGD